VAIAINAVKARSRAPDKGCHEGFKGKGGSKSGAYPDEAARLFREHGLSGVGVDALTDAAGLTHGSLYSQFGSKESLATEALGHALSTSAARMSGARTLDEYVTRYLSADHRERRGDAA